MKHTMAGLLVLLPLLASGAESSQRDFARVMARTPDVARGETLFAACASCHGTDGSGVVAGSTPRIAGQHQRVLVRQLVDYRHGKRWDFRMEGVATGHVVLPQLQDIADVAAYVSRLPPAGPSGVGDGEYLEQGAELYAGKCASCHGLKAEGHAARGVPMLAGQHAAYLSRQLYDAVDGRRLPLTRTHQRLIEPLTFDQVRGVADYLSRLTSRPEPPRS